MFLKHFHILPQILSNQPKLFQRRLQILHDLGSDDAGFGQVVRILQRLVPQPEDIETGLVAGDECLIIVTTPATFGGFLAPGGGALLPLGGIVELYELVEVAALEGVGLEGEVLVGAQVVDPELPRPGGLGRGAGYP
jgi:hypothetical protein